MPSSLPLREEPSNSSSGTDLKLADGPAVGVVDCRHVGFSFRFRASRYPRHGFDESGSLLGPLIFCCLAHFPALMFFSSAVSHGSTDTFTCLQRYFLYPKVHVNNLFPKRKRKFGGTVRNFDAKMCQKVDAVKE